MKITTFLLTLFASLCVGSASDEDQHASGNREMMQDIPIYVASADFDLTLEILGNKKSLTAGQLFKFENTASKFFSQLILQELDLAEEEVLFINVDAMDMLKTGPSQTMLRSSIFMTYTAEKFMSEFDSLLENSFGDNELRELEDRLKDKKILEEETTIEKISFVEAEQDRSVYYAIAQNDEASFEENEPRDLTGIVIGLTIGLLVQSFLCIVYLCMTNSFRICSRTKGKKTKDEQGGIEISKTSSTLGAEPREDEEGVFSPNSNRTPRKRVQNSHTASDASAMDDQDEMYPLSPSETTLGSNVTEYTSTTRAPLGIASMKKFQNYLTPTKNNGSHVPYDVTKCSPE